MGKRDWLWWEIAAMASGGIGAALGLTVLAGWYTHDFALVQGHPTLVPMQFNTALGFVLCGAGLLLAALRYRRLAMVCGGIAGVVGLLTLIEYVFGIDLRIDELLMEHSITVKTSSPGRMAPNTALAFALTGTALLLVSLRRFGARCCTATGSLGALVAVLGSIAFLGYLTGVETAYGWGRLTRMAVHTAAGFGVLGAGVFTFAWGQKEDEGAGFRGPMTDRMRMGLLLIIMAGVAFGVGSVAIFALYDAAFEQQRHRLTDVVQSNARLIEAVGRFDVLYSGGDVPGGSLAATLGQVRDAHERLPGLGETGEFTLARRQGNRIVYLLRSRHSADVDGPPPVPFTSGLAEPMRRALSRESGTVVGRDYRGQMVLAAYEPISELDLGAVAKIDLAEVRAPFVRAGMLAGGSAAVLVVLATMLFLRIANPLVRRLEGHADELRTANAKLQEIQVELERRVEGRTAELRRANEQLQDEISERKLAEEAIRASQKQLQGLVDHVPEGICLLDVQSRLVLANPVGLEYLQVLAGAAVGDTVTRVGDQALARMLRPSRDGRPHEVVTEGPPRQVFEVEVALIAEELAEERWVLVMRDLTQERDREKKIRQQYHLASVGQLAAGIAHDFNNMLTAIMGYAQVLSMREEVAKLAKEELDVIVSQGERAAQLIRQILDFSRQTVAARVPLDLVPFLKEGVKLLRPGLPENIQITMDAEVDHCPVEGNPTQLQQVFTNLAVNARDAMPEGGHLRVGVSVLRLEANEAPLFVDMPPGDWGVFTVSDTGCGIPGEVLNHIYEPFFTTKPIGKGTGLGLSQVYGIVTQHGGFIDVASNEGGGTRFTVYLPAGDGAAQEEGEVRRPVQRGMGNTVLLVEDQEVVLRSTRRLLETLGYDVVSASNGREALDTYREQGDEIAVILTDLVMPQMGGVELLEDLEGAGADTPVVLMTGYGAETIGNKTDVLKKAAGLLEKPLVIDRVAQALSEAIGTC